MRFWTFLLTLALLSVTGIGCQTEARATAEDASAGLAITQTPDIGTPTPTPPPDPTTKPESSGSSVFLPYTQGVDPTATPTPTVTPTPEPPFPRYDGPPISAQDIGVQLHLHQEDQRWLLRHLQALGVGWVKVQVSWKVYEPQQDQYAADRFDELDRLVEGATNNGINVLLGVSKAPEWSRPTTELDGPPLDYGRYRSFMQYLSSRYAGRVTAYELWNEPNLMREWNGAPLSASDLVALIAAGAEGVRASDPDATLISAAPATTGINDGITAIDDRVFLRGMLEAGVGDLVDAIGVHPYGWANPPDSTFANPDPSVPSHNDHPSFFFHNTLHEYADLLAEYDVADLPLWATEFGWGSFERLNVAPPAGAEFMNDVTEWEQAEFILRAYELAHDWDFVGPLILWNLNFGPTLGTDFSETGYSILRPDGTRRPAYRALETMQKK